jgi:hypothetical protein
MPRCRITMYSMLGRIGHMPPVKPMSPQPVLEPFILDDDSDEV